MKSMIIVALALVAVAVSFPVDDKDAKVTDQVFDQQPDGPYNTVLVVDNGVQRSEQAELKQGVNEENKPVTFLTVRGTYSYFNADGILETITYKADENGYIAEGPAVPKAERR